MNNTTSPPTTIPNQPQPSISSQSLPPMIKIKSRTEEEDLEEFLKLFEGRDKIIAPKKRYNNNNRKK